MAGAIPHGRNLDTDFLFTKLVVDDLDRAVEFYGSVFGLIEMHRLDAEITGRAISEVVFMPTCEGGPMFVLAKFHDKVGPVAGETILGFATGDLDALLDRAMKAGGRVAEQRDAGSFRHAFVIDPEGHLVQISQAVG